MDKITDGVDVSECDNLAILQDRMTDKEFTFCNAYQEDCSERENCYYKQLQRAKAEIEELKTLKDMYFTYYKAKHNDIKGEFFNLKQENEELQGKYNGLNANYNSLKFENERLKARLRPLEDSYFKGLSVIQIAELAKKSIRITAENRKLEYALQEIRDIILSPEIIDEETKKLHTSEELDNIVRWHREDKLSKIQDKINSVIGAE